MLFTPEPQHRRRAEIARDWKEGKITDEEAGRLFVEAAPEAGTGYLVLANCQADAGNLAEAEAYYWQALARMPANYGVYLAMADLFHRRDQDSPLSRQFLRLAWWKLSFGREIPEEVAERFRDAKATRLDFSDPATYEALATSMQQRDGDEEAIDARLRPYELFNDLERQTSEGLEVDRFVSGAELLIPLLRAGLREWAQGTSDHPPGAAEMMLALLGETAGPEVLEDLIDLTDIDDSRIFLHASWAIWRMGQRFPQETLERLRAASAGAAAIRRCALSEQMYLLPKETPGLAAAQLALLEGFEGFAGSENGGYLLATVMQALTELGRRDEAERVHREFEGLLSEEGREWVNEQAAGGLVPKLIEEDIAGLTIEDVCAEGLLMEGDEEDAEDEEDYDEPPAPAAAPARPGRNEPCWCGSGKKYKKCHLASDEESDRAGERAGREPEPTEPERGLVADILECAGEWHGSRSRAEAGRLYFDRPFDDLEREPDDDEMAGFTEWYIHDFRPAGTGQTLVEEYLRRRSYRLNAEDRRMLEAWRDARVGFWEVEQVVKRKGVELKDVFAGDQIFVHDVSSSRSMARWDCVLSRVYQSHGHWHFSGTGLTVPRRLMSRLRELIERESREAGQAPAEFVRKNSHRWHRLVREFHKRQLDDLKVVNAEGDALEFSKAQYEVEDEGAVVSALEAAKPFEAEEKSEAGTRSFAWLEQSGGDSRRAYGHIEIRDGTLRLECNSRKRLEIGRQLVEKHAGARLRHLGDSFQSLESIKRKALAPEPAGERGKEPEIPPEIQRELVLKYKTEHYAHWVDESLPALGGRTPREAVKSEAGRRQVEELLRDFENGEEHQARAGHAAYDFSGIRKTLGL